MSFSTAVDIALSQKAVVFPCRWKSEKAIAFAEKKDAILANPKRSTDQFSLSPSSLRNLPENSSIILPSPNGSTLSLVANNAVVLTACLRNASSVASYASNIGGKIAVVAAGEKWQDGSLRFAMEDYIGAGAIISHLRNSKSPEAQLAEHVYNCSVVHLTDKLMHSISGKELIHRGFEADVLLAAELDVSDIVPGMVGVAYRNLKEFGP